jgi:enoyl-CoA hydratase
MNRGAIRVEVDAAGIALLTVDRPEARNALNEDVVNEFRGALGELAARDGVRVLIITGAGEKAFVSGADIAELRDRTREDALRRINASLFREVELFPRPTIAAVRGYALGAGCELAIACDLRVAGESARFGQPEVSLGIIPGAGATYRLPPLIGAGRARDLIFTGRIVESAEALAIGLVNRVVPDTDVGDVARLLAAEIARQSAAAVRFAKIALLASRESSVEAAMALEAGLQATLFEDEEKKSRMSAFLERRRKKG